MAEIAPGWSAVGALTVYAFPAGQLGVFAIPYGTTRGRFQTIGPQEILDASGALAAIDGTQFDDCGAGCAYPDFLVYDAGQGIEASSLRPSDGVTICVANGQAVALPGAQLAFGTTVAMQLWPTLVAGSNVVASNGGSNANQEWRAAIAIMSPGQVAFIAGVGDMVGFATAIQALGATDAGYTDGGGSAALVVPGNQAGGTSYRAVPTWLVARPPAAVNAAGMAFGAVVAAIVAAGIAYEVLKGRRGPGAMP